MANWTDRAPADALARLEAERASQRNREAACAMDYLVYGDEHAKGPHAAFCIFGDAPCAREYDPTPYPEAVPTDSRMYEHTGIALLYGIPGGERHAWQLAGWNVRRGP